MSVRDMLMAAASASQVGYRYWRIYIQAVGSWDGYVSMDLVYLKESAGGSDIAASVPVLVSSQYDTTTGGNKLVDNYIGTPWISAYAAALPQWARFDLSTPRAIKRVEIWPQGSATHRAPKDFIVQGSNDGTNFSDVKSFTNVTGWADALKTFDL